MMSALVLLAFAAVNIVIAARIFLATRKQVSAGAAVDEMRAAIAYSQTLSLQGARMFLRAYQDGNRKTITQTWGDWPRYRDRFIATETDFRQ